MATHVALDISNAQFLTASASFSLVLILPSVSSLMLTPMWLTPAACEHSYTNLGGQLLLLNFWIFKN